MHSPLLNWFRKLFDFFIFSSLYIALCAVVMVYQTHQLLLHSPPSIPVLSFVFFASVCSYNFHWFLTPYSITSSQRTRWSGEHKGWHLVLYFIGAVGAVVSFFYIWKHWMALAFAALITFLYTAPKLQSFFSILKKIAVGKTIFLAMVWTYVTALLPVFLAGEPLQWVHIIYFINRFFLIYSICIIFDYRDREDDRREGIRSMITYFDEKGINRLFIVSLLVFAISAFALYPFLHSWPNIIVLLVPGIITAALYNYSKTHFSDYLYYFVLDGLMMLSGLIMLILQFD